MTQLRKLSAKRANRAAGAFDVGSVRYQDMNKTSDAICRLLPFNFPPFQHLPGISQTRINHRIQDFILGLEVKIEIAARDLHDIRDICERGMLVTLPIEQMIGSFNDVIAGCPVVHKHLPVKSRPPVAERQAAN
jgi:hypothetical protein